jgi:F-type H+-transporting ATPase subunit a
VEEKRKWRWGVNRWLVLLFIILGAIAASFYAPVLPHIQLPAETVIHLGGGFNITNTMIAMLLADIIVLLIAWNVRRAANSGQMVPSGLSGAIEAMLEAIYNLTESTAGRWAKQIFPWFATITLYVLIANWMELIPGVDSIGIMEHAEGAGHEIGTLIPGVVTLLPGKGEFSLVPFVRVLSTDLNFTVGLALLVVFLTQVMGVRALGGSYFTKFINVKTIFTRPIFGVIDFAVGLLEIVSEISRILSFSFRLFGNIFAGSVLLFVIGSLVPVFAQSIFLMLEFFVGIIQALVFGMLAMVFMSMATQGHGGDHEEQHQAEEMPIPGPEMI